MLRRSCGLLAVVLAAALASFPRLAATQALVPAPSAQAIAPGTGLSPSISDAGRAALILQIVDDVYNGRPLRFPKDGAVWENREGLLPARETGYYHEYTVLPPHGSPSHISIGDRDFDVPPANGTRGAERLIIGGGEILYYTPNHYRDFVPLTVLR